MQQGDKITNLTNFSVPICYNVGNRQLCNQVQKRMRISVLLVTQPTYLVITIITSQ